MNLELQKEYGEKDEFEQIDEEIIAYGRDVAQRVCNTTPDIITPKACMLLFRHNRRIHTVMTEDYHTASTQAMELIRQGINSVIYTFQDYPPVIDYVIVSDK